MFFFAFNTLILTLHIVFFFVILKDRGYVRVIQSIVFTALQSSFLYCGLKDPGIVFPALEIELGETGYCYRCGATRGGTHCAICEVCIDGYDHHCGFIGKCVGKGNIKSFYALLVCAFATMIVVVLSLAWTTWSYQRLMKK